LNPYCIVQTSFSSLEEAHKIAKLIIENKLGACIQVSSPKTSYYRWEEKIQKEEEYVLSVKTKSKQFDALQRFINKHHSYDVPEIICISIDQISDEYAAWLDSEVD
jgi:periplasmic divalent cation tolerance protein